MKIVLIITDNLPSQINGVVTTYKNIEPHAIHDGYQIKYINPLRFWYFDCPKYDQVKLALPFAIGRMIREISPDFIHIATEGPIGLCARIYLTSRGIRYNTAYHTKFPEGLKKILNMPEKLTWNYIRWFHKHTGKVLTTTESMVEELKKNKFDGEIVSWTRGVDRKIYKFNQPKNVKTTLVCVSRVSKEKSLEDFFKLDYNNCRKIMVGDGPMRETYQKQYPNVEFVGFKTGKELAEYYQLADVFVFPSRWETFGIVMIEAMACGTPVAAYPCQGPIDVIDQNLTGFMHLDLKQAVDQALLISRQTVYENSFKWSWENTWQIFKNNLTKI